MAGRPSPRACDAMAPMPADLKSPPMPRSRMRASSHSRVTRATYARRFRVEENFSQAFFCHCLGPGKFQPKLFFAIVSGNPADVGDVGGARRPPPLVWGL